MSAGRLSVVAAGLLLGHRGAGGRDERAHATYVFGFWEVLDEVLNAVLFLLLGLQLTQLDFQRVSIVLSRLRHSDRAAGAAHLGRRAGRRPAEEPELSLGNVPFLTWAGVRGGISVALALSIPGARAAHHSGGDLRCRAVQHPRPGLDAEAARAPAGRVNRNHRAARLVPLGRTDALAGASNMAQQIPIGPEAKAFDPVQDRRAAITCTRSRMTSPTSASRS